MNARQLKSLPAWKASPIVKNPKIPNHVGQRRAKLEDGSVITIPHLPYEWWVDPAGNVVTLVLSTNQDPQYFDAKYAKVTELTKRRAGWLKVAEYADDYEALALEIKARQAKQAEAMAKFQVKDERALLRDIVEAQGQNLEAVLSKVMAGGRQKDSR